MDGHSGTASGGIVLGGHRSLLPRPQPQPTAPGSQRERQASPNPGTAVAGAGVLRGAGLRARGQEAGARCTALCQRASSSPRWTQGTTCSVRGWTSLSSCEPRQDDASQTPESSGSKLVAGENVPHPHSLCGFCPREQKCGLARVKQGGQGPRQPVSSLCLHAHRKGPRAGRSASLSALVRAPGPWPELQHRPAFLHVCPAPAREGGHVRSPSAACPGLACCRLSESQEGTCVVPHGLAR